MYLQDGGSASLDPPYRSGLLSYRGNNNNATRKYIYPDEKSRDKLPLEIASISQSRLVI
jgi:hypothetical protein